MFYDYLDYLKIDAPWHISPAPHVAKILSCYTAVVLFLLFADRLAWPAVVEALSGLDFDEAEFAGSLGDYVDLPYNASFNTITR